MCAVTLQVKMLGCIMLNFMEAFDLWIVWLTTARWIVYNGFSTILWLV